MVRVNIPTVIETALLAVLPLLNKEYTLSIEVVAWWPLVEGIYVSSIIQGSHIQIALEMSSQNQQQMNIWYYTVGEIALGVTAHNIAEAWWAHVKTAYRATAVATQAGFKFLSVTIRDDDDPAGDAAAYAIPSAEQAGTRSTPVGGTDLMPPYAAATARLHVGTRATRSGSKRFGFLYEADNVHGYLDAGFKGVVEGVLAAAATIMTLGAPALLTTLVPVVKGRGASNPPVITYQPITGYSVSPYVTTQNSRKFGRGA